MVYCEEWDEEILKPNEKAKVSKGGYHVGRCYGQTHIKLPPGEIMGLDAETIYQIGKEFYPERRGIEMLYFCRDCISLEVPPCTDNENYYEPEERKKLWDKDPSNIFPEYYKPEEFVIALYEASNLALVRNK